MENKGIKELKEAVDLVVAGIKAVQTAQSDGSINLSDAGLVLTLIPKIGPAIENIGAVPGEIADLSAEEVAELSASIMASQAVDGEKAKALIEGGFQIIGGAVKIIGALKAK